MRKRKSNKTVTVKEYMMKIRQFLLNEERLDNKDKGVLMSFIKKPKNTSFLLKSFSKNYDESEREVDVRKMGNGVEFSYNMDHYELTNALVDIVDGMDRYSFHTSGERETNTMYFQVVLKTSKGR